MILMTTSYAENIKIRTATLDDAKEMLEIYRDYAENTVLTFEYAAPSLEEFKGRICKVTERYPYLVAESDGQILGFAYASVFRARPAYDWGVETTIYLNRRVRKQGIGRALYDRLAEVLATQGLIKMVACITYPVDELSNFGSMQFHEKLGYRLAGRLSCSGYKLGKWYDTIYMEKFIGEPKEEAPPIRTFNEVREQFGL